MASVEAQAQAAVDDLGPLLRVAEEEVRAPSKPGQGPPGWRLSLEMVGCASDVPRLFRQIPEENRGDEVLVEKFVQKCSPFCIPELFDALPQESRGNEELVEKFVQMCRPSCVLQLFRALPQESRGNEELVEKFVQKCDPCDIPKLFKALPQKSRGNEKLLEMSMQQCDPLFLPELFDGLPHESRGDDEISEKFAQKCAIRDIADISGAFPVGVLEHGERPERRLFPNHFPEPGLYSRELAGGRLREP
jgi:hypothetical protein